jgi:hypothetical protein
MDMLELRMPPNVLEWPEMAGEENFSRCHAQATRRLLCPILWIIRLLSLAC